MRTAKFRQGDKTAVAGNAGAQLSSPVEVECFACLRFAHFVRANRLLILGAVRVAAGVDSG
jgi:hypothetical protein